MKNSIFLLLLISATLISACSSTNRIDCQNTNWRDRGYNDAIQGRGNSLASYSNACANVGIAPNRNAYLAGHKLGSKQYCTFDNGVRFGSKGNVPNGVCTDPALRQEFYRGYRIGREVYIESAYYRDSFYDDPFWFSGGYYSLSETSDPNTFLYKDLRYPMMDENDPNSTIFKFTITKKEDRWEAAPFSAPDVNRGSLDSFWTRLKGI